MIEENSEVVEVEDDEEPSVPTDLLELHVALEESDVSPEAFKEAYGS